MADEPVGRNHELRRVTVWGAFLYGDRKQIHKSEFELRQRLTQKNYLYQPSNAHAWTVEPREEEVPVVYGEEHDWDAEGGQGGVHIHWECPHCGQIHHTDKDPDDGSPYLWSCDWNRGVALVIVRAPAPR
jgi:hypothetical protein